MRTLAALLSTLLLAIIAQYGFASRPPGWAIVAGYLALYVLFGRVGPWAVDARDDDEEVPEPPDMPTSGPIGRLGQGGLIVVWFGTQLLVLLNPFQLVEIVRQQIGNAALGKRERQSGSDGRDRPTVVTYRLPFDGEWLLYNGGPTPKTSHSWEVLGQRFALDFVVCDEAYGRHSGRGTNVTDYFAYGRDILAAADGEVVAVEDRVRTAPLVGWGVCDFTARSFIGNRVLIRHADDEYGLYAHLIGDSIAVRPGDRVRAGEFVGRCGHTGHSSEPHLHFHVQDSADLFGGMGRPIRFRDFSIDGEEAGEADRPTAGQRLAPMTRTPEPERLRSL